MSLLEKLRQLVDRIHIAYLRHRYINRKMDELVDPTFLDRALAGEKKA